MYISTKHLYGMHLLDELPEHCGKEVDPLHNAAHGYRPLFRIVAISLPMIRTS